MRHILKKAVVGLLPQLPPPVLLQLLRLRRNLTYSLPKNMEIVWPWYVGDAKVHINSGNAIEHGMFFDYKRGLGAKLSLCVKEGDFCIDIGANVGAVTVMLAKLVGAKGRVLSFEPGPPYMKRLKSNIALNPGMENMVTLVNQGLSDVPGELTWTMDEKSPWNAVMVDGLTTGTGMTVPVTTLDMYFEAHPWERLDFVKIDVESMELEVIKGASATLTRFKPTVVFETFIEFRMKRGFDIFAECEKVMRGLGYNLYGMDDEGNFIDVDCNSMQMDTIAVHQSKSAKLKRA